MRLSEDRNHSAYRVCGAIDPRVVVITTDDPLIRPFAAAKPCDHIVGRHGLKVELELQMDCGGTGAEVVRDRERAAPRFRRNRAIQSAKQGQRIAIGDRQDRNLGQRCGVL